MSATRSMANGSSGGDRKHTPPDGQKTDTSDPSVRRTRRGASSAQVNPMRAKRTSGLRRGSPERMVTSGAGAGVARLSPRRPGAAPVEDARPSRRRRERSAHVRSASGAGCPPHVPFRFARPVKSESKCRAAEVRPPQAITRTDRTRPPSSRDARDRRASGEAALTHVYCGAEPGPSAGPDSAPRTGLRAPALPRPCLTNLALLATTGTHILPRFAGGAPSVVASTE